LAALLRRIGGRLDGRLESNAEGNDLPDIPLDLLAALRERRCMVFIGAGFSANAGMSTFAPLLRQLAGKVDPEADRDQPQAVRRYSSKQLADFSESEDLKDMSNDGLDKVQFELHRCFGQEVLCEELRKSLYKADTVLPDVYVQQRDALLKLPFVCAATWNWDDLLDGFFDAVPLSGFQFDDAAISGS